MQQLSPCRAYLVLPANIDRTCYRNVTAGATDRFSALEATRQIYRALKLPDHYSISIHIGKKQCHKMRSFDAGRATNDDAAMQNVMTASKEVKR